LRGRRAARSNWDVALRPRGASRPVSPLWANCRHRRWFATITRPPQRHATEQEIEREENAFCGSDNNGDRNSFRWLDSTKL
jgi:hypothetical protein